MQYVYNLNCTLREFTTRVNTNNIRKFEFNIFQCGKLIFIINIYKLFVVLAPPKLYISNCVNIPIISIQKPDIIPILFDEFIF